MDGVTMVDIGCSVSIVGLEDLLERWRKRGVTYPLRLEPLYIVFRTSQRLERNERCFDPGRLPE